MTINPSDIKLLQSERMTDTTDGGGRRTSVVIPDGVAGNIFPKVSRLDSVYGRVNLRKVFAQVDTPNSDTYAGAHVAIIDAADNSKIKVNIFSTGNDFDTRTNARDRIESYVISGPESRMVLYGRQLAGQQAITTVQRVEDVLPDVGDVYCLSKEAAGVITYQQYVRIEEVTHEVRTFTDANGDFTRRVVTLKTSAPLRYEFVGIEDISRYSNAARTSLVRTTSVADAARYYGIEAIKSAVLQGALELTLGSVFSPIVPTTQREAAVSNAETGGAVQLVAATTAAAPTLHTLTGDGDIPGTNLSGVGHSINVNIGPIKPGSLELVLHYIDLAAHGNGTTTSFSGITILRDDGNGGIGKGPSYGLGFINNGTIDYETGALSLYVVYSGTYDGAVYGRYIPAVEVSQAPHRIEQKVTLASRGTVQVFTLNPLPAKGTTFVDFRALGKWIRLQDDGAGQLTGADPAYGTGTVNYTTGALVATLGALPDVSSSVIVGWASPTHYAVRAFGASDVDATVAQRFTLAELPVKPATLSVKYTSGVTEYTALADASGTISGGGITGTVNHTTGEVELRYSTRLPNTQTGLTVSYSKESANDPAGAPTLSAGVGTIVSGANTTFATAAGVQTRGLRVMVPVFIPGSGGEVGRITTWPASDDGAGNLVTLAYAQSASGTNYSHAGGVNVGTVNYGTGVVSINLAADLSLQFPRWVAQLNSPSGGSWVTTAQGGFNPGLGDYSWGVRLGGASTAQAKNIVVTQADAPLTLDLTKTITSQIVPSTVWFTLGGQVYFDRNGTLYTYHNGLASPLVGGSIDYGTGRVVLADYVASAAIAPTVQSCLTKFGNFTTTSAAFRTAGSPLRSASTFVQATAADGAVLTATCNDGGVLTGDFARGTVNQQMGLVSIEWGSMQGGAWVPREVMPETIRYNTVVLSNLPVNADILGLDPVRLPSDGRVPIYRAGDVVLIHNTKTTALPNPVIAGSTYNVGRADLVDLVLTDANGLPVPASQFAVDLVNGSITMAADMNLGALVQPLKAKHRIEELNLTTDVQINGQITMASPLSRDFDADTFVSSALLFGDMFSRVSNIFDQVTWTGEWSDARIGANGTAEFNSIGFPIEVKNDGAVTERWRINFTTATAFQVIGENLGVIATGATNADCAPLNPLTNKPYFTIRAGGWGAGWVVGQQLRFNTIGATGSIWMARTVLPGATLDGDSIDIQVRGDVDA